MSGRVDRVELRFGLASDLSGQASGHPLVTFNRAGGIVPCNTADWTAASGGNWPAVSPGVDFASVAQGVRLPTKQRSDGPVTAIAIAPDSPLDACDLVIGSPTLGNFHRVSVGAPFIGVIAEDVDLLVVPAGLCPVITRPKAIDAAGNQSNAWGRTTLLWDCFNPIGANGSQTEQRVPLRLNVYRGGYPSSLIKRAPYDAVMNYEVMQDIGAGVQAQPALIVITAGRRRVAIDVGMFDLGNSAEAASVRIDACVPYKTTGQNELFAADQADLVDWTNLVPATPLVAGHDNPFTFDYNGRPFYAFCVSITGAAIAPNVVRGYMNLRAYDE